MRTSALRPTARVSWTVGTALLVGSFLVLAFSRSDPPLHFDTITDYLIARDCVDRGECGSHAHSVLGLRGGRTVIYLLLTGDALGIGANGTLLLAHLLNALSVLVVWHTARRYLGSAAAVPAGIGMLGAVLWLTGLPMLWNPTMAPLPLSGFFLFLIRMVVKDRPTDPYFAGVMIGAAMSAHQICMVLVPLTFLVAELASDRPHTGVLATVAGLLTSTLTLDFPVTVENVERLAAAGLLAPTGLALAASISIGAALRRRALQLTRETLVRTVIVLVAAGGAIGSAVLSVGLGAGVELRYLIAVAPAVPLTAGVLVAATVARASRRPARLAIVAVASALALAVVARASDDVRTVHPLRPEEPQWTFTEGMEIVDRLRGRGMDLASSQSHLLAARAHELRPAFAMRADRDSARPPVGSPVFFVGRPLADVESGRTRHFEVVPLRSGGVAVIGSYAPYIVPDTFGACFGPAEGSDDEGPDDGECADVTSDSYAPLSDRRRRNSQLSDLAVPVLRDALDRAEARFPPPLRARYRMRVRPRGHLARTAYLMWPGRIARVEDANHVLSADRRSVTLRPDERGTLVVDVVESNPSMLLVAPVWLELGPEDAPVAEWLGLDRP